ncbi:Transforming growth factor-beta receptor-associated protein 1 homolog [Olea europaea subsp. europaea]|uniref:Transforming growth factor-beta receptor-associated protein 1 homolog n=1 Tax=Olea europaea subsp. europaea TaxID=158383 RepID=A0A8S0SHV8_OLEEU|nr:Transforming growth factor-beta receptor-associated protein 1 homolog [Olea europaea subsp. europaea]
MAAKPKSRTVLEPLADSAVDTNNSPIKSVSLSKLSDTETLVYLGTLSGTLLLYSLKYSPDSPPGISFLRRVSISGTGSSVNSIHPLAHIGKVVVHCDGSLFLLDDKLLQPAKRISLIKGVTACCRKFRIQKLGNNPFPQTSNGGSYTNHNYANATNSNGNSLFAIGMGKKLVLAELILSGSLVILKEIQGIFDGTIMNLVWVDDSLVFGSKTGYYLYNCVNGQCGLIFSLPDSSSSPQLKLLARECRVLLMVDNVGIIVDTEGQPVGGSLVFKEVPDSIGEIGSYVVGVRNAEVELYHKKTGDCVQRFMVVGDGGGGLCIVNGEENESGKLLVITTCSKVLCYRKVSGEEQIKDLLRKKNFKETISLVEELQSEGELTKEMLSFVHAQVGFLLLFDLHFEEAVDHFLLSETMQPSELFPFILRDPNRWTLMVPRNRYWGLHPPPAPLENVIDDGLTAIQRAVFLKKAGVETAVSDEFHLNPPSRADLLESAIQNMIRYLQACRDRDLTHSVREGVDTLLMYLYRALNRVDDMERLASSENSCVVEELEALLNDSGHLRALAFLYARKGMSAKALGIWRILARNYSQGRYYRGQSEETGSTRENKDTTTDLNVSSRNVIFGRETAALEASRILEESSDQELVLQHLGWIADINQMLAVQVLISEKRTNQLSPDDVIAAIDLKKVEILQRYLQWLIEEQYSDDTRFHTTYALLLAKSALETYEMELSTQNSSAGMLKNEMYVSEFGEDSIFDTPVRERLQIFLESSDLYDAEDVLDLIEESELWLEKAILYRKLGHETLVLQILALKLEDCEAAEQYCVEIGRPDAYMQLLEMYLNPKDGREPMFKAAVRLLHNHGEMLDPLQVLERLSPTMPLQLASDTILRMLRARLHHHRQGQIVHNMSRALDIDASLARLEERSRHVLINDESVCSSCHARLGTKLFAMYPDDTVVCYKCFRRQGESTSVTGRNFEKDPLAKPGWLVTR